MTGSRLCPYARILASWCGENGEVNPGLMRPGIVRYFIAHSVEIEGKQKIHIQDLLNEYPCTMLYGRLQCFTSLFTKVY